MVATESACAECGRPIEQHDRDLRFGLPDLALNLSPEQESTTWHHGDLLQVPGVGAFVHVLLPVHLTGGHQITFATWLAVHPGTLRQAYDVWREPEYADLVLEGVLANAVPPWGRKLFGCRAVARVRHNDELPWLEETDDELLDQVLRAEWPHEAVLSALPG